MEPLDRIKAYIPNFAGYESEETRGVSDEQIRAFVGERLALLPAAQVDALSATEREHYDRVLLRCEFANIEALAKFSHDPGEACIAATLSADADVLAAARDLEQGAGAGFDSVLARLDEAFDKRYAAMQTR